MLQEQIKKDLIYAIKCGDIIKKSNLRILLGEISRQPNKEVSDSKIIKIIKKMVKDEMSIVDVDGNVDFKYINLLKEYLPEEISDEELCDWIYINIDFTQFSNRMQAMKPIMKHFGSSVDGNKVKQVLMEM